MLKLTDDILIYILSFLQPPSILFFRRTCKRLHQLSYQRIVWTNACTTHILSNAYPFPSDCHLPQLNLDLLEQYTLKSWYLASRWRRSAFTPPAPRVVGCLRKEITSISDVRFLPCLDRTLVVTISKSIWSGLTVWALEGDVVVKRCEWFPRGAIFTGFAVESGGVMAVSVWKEGEHIVHILSLDTETYTLNSIASLNTVFRPIALSGDVLALSDDISKSLLWDWQHSTYAILQSSPLSDDENQGGARNLFQYDRCIQVIFAYHSILVVSARSINLFPSPVFSTIPSSSSSSSDTPASLPAEEPDAYQVHVPLAHHSFGWVDGVAVSASAQGSHVEGQRRREQHGALSILLRPESDDPWYPTEKHKLEMYTLYPNLDFEPRSLDGSTTAFRSCTPPQAQAQLPYAFPPRLTYSIPTRHGVLRCTSLALGKCGTGVWIEPRMPRTMGGLVQDPRYLRGATKGDGKRERERVMCAVFPGPLYVSRLDVDGCEREELETGSVPMQIRGMELDLSGVIDDDGIGDWAAFEYDESRGRLVLASSYGRVLVLEV
ncbi:hypothetical protein K443DRAFT_676139 [Laccaria amethystina LaAM-08-1]|uniref:F-box domain-containing protein n=1 Tax=Laccaria amethystina LaAM-08-1 TaxID=1095629 RepID=A0A0C9WWU9_9AGAR|nr:hypothetical protein K443DRAFT_676139 [Laccaria amethystina LaAM-08-1]